MELSAISSQLVPSFTCIFLYKNPAGFSKENHNTQVGLATATYCYYLPLFAAALVYMVSFCPPTIHSLATPAPPPHNASEADRQALLCLRSHLSATPVAAGAGAGALDSWSNDSFTFCDDWRGVTCSNSTTGAHAGRVVVAIRLESLGITGQIPPCIGDLRFLDGIHMADNQISGHIPADIGRLSRLRHLNLSMNSITGVIPNTISSCTLLEVISLWNNSIGGEIPPALAQCSSLTEIVLSNNNLSGSIPSGIGLLPNLKYLYLANNRIEGTIPHSLGSSTTTLSVVIIGNNSLTGSISPMLANCSSLSYLDLMRNKLTGDVPAALLNSSSLGTLELSYNELSGPIPSSSSSPMSSKLEYIGLAGNNLSGEIPATLGNFSSLSTLLLAQNQLHGSIPESLARIQNLQALDLAYNQLSGAVPPALYTVKSLSYLGLGVNRLSGRIPSDIAYTLPNIQTLVMEGNKFHGPLPASLVNASNLQVLELSDNAFTGSIPSFWSLPYLTRLDFGFNQFEAVDWSSLYSSSSVPASGQLEELYLDNNKLGGELPASIGNLPKGLQLLFMSDNKFTGGIPLDIARLTSLTVLQFGGNLLTGAIPDALGDLTNLYILGLSRNKLSGRIRETLGNFEQLGELYLQENNLSGSIPSSLGDCKNLVMLNLSCNGFHGSISPGLLSISSLSKALDMSYNRLNGSIPSEIGDLVNLGSLNISNNELTGEIPHALGECLHLESLRLELNFLDGSIPQSLMSLRGITEMDLSRNNLSGEIPEFFETFSSLQLLNLSFNNLEGTVPGGGAFSNLGKVFVQGNKELCVGSPMLQLPLCTSTTTKRKKTLQMKYIVAPLASVVIIVMMSAIATIVYKRRNQSKQHSDQSLKELKKFSYVELARATDIFLSANVIGSGTFGVVYKGIAKFQAHPIAIKVFKLDQIGAPKNFVTECEVLRNTRHRNLMQVISLCSGFDGMGNEFKALVFDYMSNGNLESWLHPRVHQQKGPKRPLSLGSRIIIAMDVAAALEYLHNWCTPNLVHCDLKPSNVLLDDAMGARVSEYGLAKFLCDYSSASLHELTSMHGPRGSIGYIAPEYGMGSEISTAGDVYSYGVILLEMLTGKHPTDEIFKDGLNLHRLVASAFPQDIGDILESSLIPYYKVEEANHSAEFENHQAVRMQTCIMQLVELGLKCSMDSPKDRPTMQDVYAEILTIKETFSALRC